MKKLVRLLIAAVTCASVIGASVALAEQSVIIKGSTTVLPIVQAATEAYMKAHPGVNISLSGGGSGDGIKALIDKTTDIADSSRSMKPEEIELAKSKGVEPMEHKIAIDAIVPVVNKDNPVKDLSNEQLNLIYQGKITNWKEVGGKDLQIVVISRDTSSGTYETWEQKILKGAKVTPKAQLQASNGAIVQVVSKNRYAIGYVGLGYVNKSLKGLKVNGIQASSATALSGEYPIARPLFMYTNGEPKGETANFLKFMKGAQGQKIVKEEGFVPLPHKK
ncbi:MAG: PstS family phosphate ABC transporter substrate-binding protein [Smithellaceae bacterium]|nr:PstS family phosphate ABC transporter substrate-binding protein [Smithellaceae bacterium]